MTPYPRHIWLHYKPCLYDWFTSDQQCMGYVKNIFLWLATLFSFINHSQIAYISQRKTEDLVK